MNILVASANEHKVKEVESILRDQKVITLSLRDFPPMPEVPENGTTLEENSLIKALAYHEETGMSVIADDTGLLVDALNGEPGVYSARYAGEFASYSDNCKKLLKELTNIGIEFSPAKFKTVICYLKDSDDFNFYIGEVSGKIINEMRGDNGFGYDPLFIPDGYNTTFAEMTDEEKNKISHRARAVENFLNNFRKL